jgi:hypothetical protein
MLRTNSVAEDSRPVMGPRGMRSLNGYFSRVRPLPGRGLLVRNYNSAAQTGQISVAVRREDNQAVRFFCKIGADQASNPMPMDLSNLNGLVELDRVAGGVIYQAGGVAVSGIADVASGTPIKIGIGAYGSANKKNDEDYFTFIAVPQTATANVESKACLFLAFIPMGVGSPNPGEKTPYAAVTPMDATQVVLSVPMKDGAEQTWTHSGGDSNVPVIVPAIGERRADGTWDADETNDSRYWDGTLMSDRIARITAANLPDAANRAEGLLAAMWEFGREDGTENGRPRPSIMMPVGSWLYSNNTLTLPIETSSDGAPSLTLRFGSHQENQWHKANGSLNVRLEWQ